MGRDVDLGDTTGCPVGLTCEACGRRGPALRVVAADVTTPGGVLCLTVCDDCHEDGRMPRLSLLGGMNAMAFHCGHLGITLDDMAALVEAEQDGGW